MGENTARKLDPESASTINCHPFLKWAGGKRQLLSHLLARVPEKFGSYHEPFVGGGALFFALQPKRAYLSDTNRELVNCYRVIQDSVGPLIEDLKKHVYDQEYFYKVRDIDRNSEYEKWNRIEKASRLIFLNRTCYNGLYRVNSRGFFNTPFGRYTDPKIVDEPNLRACHKVLKDAKIVCESYLNVELIVKKGDFVYFDPPYFPVSATSSFASYSSDGFTADNHRELRDLCKRLDRKGVRFMLTNSSTPFVRELYADFKVEAVEANRAINSKGARRGKIHELIVTNY
jgi:DNA adenine methylase